MKEPLASEEEVWYNYIKATKVPHFGPIAFKHAEIIGREKEMVKKMTQVSFIGSKESVARQIVDLQKRVNFDELIINSYIYDEKAQYYSFKLLKEVVDELNRK